MHPAESDSTFRSVMSSGEEGDVWDASTLSRLAGNTMGSVLITHTA